MTQPSPPASPPTSPPTSPPSTSQSTPPAQSPQSPQSTPPAQSHKSAAPETLIVDKRRVACDGASGIRGGDSFRPAALGHPKIYLEIDDSGAAECGYCDRRFVLKGGPADR